MNTLQVLTDPADRLACLRRIRAHLREEGEFIFDVALPDVEEITESIGVERSGGRHRDPASGATLVHSAWYDSWEPATRTLEFTLRIVAFEDGATRETLRHHRVHLFSPEEIGELLTLCRDGAGQRHGRLRRLADRALLRAPDPSLPGGPRVSAATPALRLGHLYPGEMNIYADRGNIAVLERRLAWRGLSLEVTEIGIGDPVAPGAHDLYYLGRRPGPRPGGRGRGSRHDQGGGPAARRSPTAQPGSASAGASSWPAMATPGSTARGCPASASSTSTPWPGRRA